MIVFQIFLISLIVKVCFSDILQILHTFNPASTPLTICPLIQHQSKHLDSQPILKNSTAMEMSKDNLKFILPFLDMEIQCDRNLHVMQELQKQQIFILHGNELYQMFINRQEKRLSLMGVLEGSVRYAEPLEAKIIYWHGNILLVIALDEHLEVFELAEDILIQRAEVVKDPARAHESAPIFEAIQQLTLPGKFQKLFLFAPSGERIMIIAAVNFTKLYGKVRIFEWFNSYFNPVEEITAPTIHVINVIGLKKKYLVTGRTIKHQSRTILTVYEIGPPSLILLAIQTLTVESRVVHIFTYRHRNMIVACSSKQHKCSSFRQMPDGQFSVYRRRTSKEFAFDLMSSSSRFVTATKQNQVMVFVNHRLDCYSSFKLDQMGITNLIGYRNSYNEDYVLLVYKMPFKALVRIVELEINVKDSTSYNQSEPEDILALSRNQHIFESTVGQLRSMLLQRKIHMELFRKVLHILRPKLKVLKVRERIILHEGNVDIIKVTGEALRTPQQIVEKIESLRQTYLLQRSKRSDKPGLLNTNTKERGRMMVNRIKVYNLIYQGDILEGFSLNETNLQEKLLTIKPKVSTRSLSTSELILPHNKRQSRQHTIPGLFFDFISSFRVRHLIVDFINDVPWSTFFNSLFLKNRDKLVEGRLVLQSKVNVTHLTATNLNGLVVSNVFNLKHPQVIHSDLVISRFFVRNLKAKRVNGLIFEEDIVFSGTDNYIETPVIMRQLNIAGDLFLAYNIKAQQLSGNRSEIEFQQFYFNKIIVNGSLILKNLKSLNNKTKVILGDLEFNKRIINDKYLLRKQAQNFSFPVLFDEAKVTAPYLESKYLNDYKTEQHMLVNKMNTVKPLLVIFMNAHIQGDVISRDYKSTVAEIKDNIIYPGDKVNITGIKIFEASLEVYNVEVLTLNQLPVNDLVFKTVLSINPTIQFKDSKNFTTIKVKKSSIVDKELNALYLNNLPLEDLFNNNYSMDRLYVPHLLETTNVVFHKINGIPFDEFFTKIDIKDDQLILHKDVVVEGSAQFAEILELQDINNISWNEYIKNLVHINKHAIITGEVIFNNDLTITKDFETSEVNGFDLELIFKNVLMKSKPQMITGLYHFDNMTCSNLDVSKINDVNVSEFVDLTKNITEIEGDIIIKNLNVGRNLRGNLNKYESLLYVKEKISQLPRKPWKNLYVLNNVSWSADVNDNAQQELLKYLYKSAVKTNQDQTIAGNVKISKPLITKMQTRLKFPPKLDIDFIQRDALLKNSLMRQHVRGEKVFLKPLYMNTLKAKRNLNTKFLNKIDVLRFNLSLYRSSYQEPLYGPLKFMKPLTVGHLHIKGLINGLDTSLIYKLMPNSILPALKLQELHIENDLYIKNINNMNVEYFLDNRLTRKGPAVEHFGILTFEYLIIKRESVIQNINGIHLDHMIFKHSPYLQTITGHKTINNSLVLAGPAHILSINNKDVMELYRSSLLKEYNYQFDTLVMDQGAFERGLQVVRNLNYNIHQRSFADSDDITKNNKTNFFRFLKEFKKNFTNSSNDIIYLDYNFNTLIKWQTNHIETTVNQTMFYELFRISCCERKFLQISFQYPNKFFLKNITKSRLTDISKKISVKAENYCVFQNCKTKSKITISHQKLLKVFSMKRYIEAIYFLGFDNSSDHFIIFHALDLSSHKGNEVRIFKISSQNNTITEWQALTQNIGERFKLYKLFNLNVFITNGLSDHHPALMIYHFNHISQLFNLLQIIDGDYDIMEMIEIPNNAGTKQLILSCYKCQRIFIYEFNPSQPHRKYEILQIINLNSSIDKLITFCLNNQHYILAISQRISNFYSIYKYSYIQGWLHLTTGHFPNYQMCVPLKELWSKNNSFIVSKSSDGIPLILLCYLDDCYLVTAIL